MEAIMAAGYVNNAALETIIKDENWKGTPVDARGRYVNLQHPYSPSFMEVIRWKMKENRFKAEKEKLRWKPDVLTDASWLNGDDDVIAWLGHCTFFIRIGGIRLLTDPVFGDILAVKRVSPFPVNPILLTKLDYILLSHDHRDHCDKPTLQRLARNNPKATYLAGLGMEPLIREFTSSEQIQEAGWYQQYQTAHIKITYVPARHWGKRGAFDTNRRLWGGFVIESAQRRIYFGGDSGYDTHYQQLQEVFGGFDYALLGIGAFEPEWFMHPVHQSPALAIKAMEELQAKHAIPMHFGTFDLSDEPLDLPLRVFKQVATENGLEKRIKPLRIGEALHLA